MPKVNFLISLFAWSLRVGFVYLLFDHSISPVLILVIVHLYEVVWDKSFFLEKKQVDQGCDQVIKIRSTVSIANNNGPSLEPTIRAISYGTENKKMIVS